MTNPLALAEVFRHLGEFLVPPGDLSALVSNLELSLGARCVSRRANSSLTLSRKSVPTDFKIDTGSFIGTGALERDKVLLETETLPKHW